MNENHSQVDVLVLDFSKAFDIMPHQRLILKLQHYEITESTKNWIEAFLSSHTPQVVINGSSSNVKSVTSPQGKVG